MAASIRKVQQILHWFDSQHQLTFYASSLLFVYEGLPSSFSSSSLSSLLSSPSISPTMVVKTATSSSSSEGGGRREGKVGQVRLGQEEEVAEYNNNIIQVAGHWDYRLDTVYANHRKGDDSQSEDSGAVSSVSGDNVSALCEEDNSAWKRSGELQQPPNGNGNKPQLEGKDEGGEYGSSRRRSGEEAKDQGGDETEGIAEGTEVEVRMIDFAHVFPSESHDHGYIYGLKHLLRVLEQILCDAA